MQRDSRLTVAGIAATAVGIGLQYLVPQVPHIIALYIFIGGAVLLIYCLIPMAVKFHEKRKNRMMPLIIMALTGIAFIAALAWYIWPTPGAPNKSPFVELEDIYIKDFPELLSAERKLTIDMRNPTTGLDMSTDIRVRVHQDFRANSYFISTFVPLFHDARADFYSFAISLRDTLVQTSDDLRSSVVVGSKEPGGSYIKSRQLTFSGRVFLYTLNNLDTIQIGNLATYYREKGMFLEIRGTDYWLTKQKLPS